MAPLGSFVDLIVHYLLLQIIDIGIHVGTVSWDDSFSSRFCASYCYLYLFVFYAVEEVVYRILTGSTLYRSNVLLYYCLINESYIASYASQLSLVVMLGHVKLQLCNSERRQNLTAFIQIPV